MTDRVLKPNFYKGKACLARFEASQNKYHQCFVNKV